MTAVHKGIDYSKKCDGLTEAQKGVNGIDYSDEKATDYIIFTCRVGSELYGLSDTTTDSDIDLMSVTIMPPSDVLGIAPFEGLEYRTAGKGNRIIDTRPTVLTHNSLVASGGAIREAL